MDLKNPSIKVQHQKESAVSATKSEKNRSKRITYVSYES